MWRSLETFRSFHSRPRARCCLALAQWLPPLAFAFPAIVINHHSSFSPSRIAVDWDFA